MGEQPGDHEDRAGVPFVGPAGRLLRAVMDEVGIDPASTYLTNAVKHFKFERRGTLRLHKPPSAGEIAACRPWLAAELGAIRPAYALAMGATAARALVGPRVRVTRDRGAVLEGVDGTRVVPTVHPSSILRAPDSRARGAAREAFASDLAQLAQLARGASR